MRKPRGKGLAFTNVGMVSDEQVDFERARNDQSHVKSAKTLMRSRLRDFNSAGKAFRLRGLTGHDKRLVSKGAHEDAGRRDTSVSAKVALANKKRVQSLTGGVSKKATKMMAPHASFPALKQPQASRQQQKIHSSKVVHLDVNRLVADFRRRNILPEVSLRSIESVGAKIVDKKNYLKLRQALLIREGIEQNPGPPGPGSPSPSDALARALVGLPDCTLTGCKVKGELLRLRGKQSYICPSCTAMLTGVKGGWGMHPGVRDDSKFTWIANAAERPELEPQPETAKAEVPSSLSFPALKPSKPYTAKAVKKTAPSLNNLAPVISELALKPEPERHPASEPVVEPTNVLDGHSFDKKELYDAYRWASGTNRSDIFISIKDAVVPYTSENRLATDRHVQVIEAPMRAVQMSSRIWKRTGGSWTVLCTCLVVIVLALLPTSGQLPCRNRSVAVNSCPFLLRLNPTWADSHECLTRQVDYCHTEFTTVVCSYWTTVLLVPLAALVAVLSLPRFRITTFSICFLPHALSAVAAEYAIGTNLTVLRSNVRQKLLRLACLPTPDYDAARLLAGTEIMIEYFVQHKSFFEGGASIMRRKDLVPYSPPR